MAQRKRTKEERAEISRKMLETRAKNKLLRERPQPSGLAGLIPTLLRLIADELERTAA